LSQEKIIMRKSFLGRRISPAISVFPLLPTLTCLPHSGIASAALAQDHDIVVLHGRIMDPESNLDAVRNIGISKGTIQAISSEALHGRTTIDATELIVAPGFIDLHVHDMNEEHHRAQAVDGVTTALDLEIGTADVDQWYAEREGEALINYGVSIGHVPARMQVMHDPGSFVPSGEAAHRAASEEEVEELRRRLEQGLQHGAVAVGFGINYTAAASHWEILEMFRVAARFGASCHVHLRYGGIKEPWNGVTALEEVLAAAAITGAPLHVVHVTSVGLRDTPQLLQMISEARARGLDVTTECYPYTAGMTAIESAIFDEGWRERMGIDYQDLQWTATGERLNAESFAQYRKTGGMIAVFSIPENVISAAIALPLTMIASDGLLQNGKGHPRAAGTYSRVLGRYVRAARVLMLMDALRKMTLLPAQRLEPRVPLMKNKGRIRVGADADLTIFDAERVIDKATFEEPGKYSEGIRHVLVNGVIVVKNGQLQSDISPGRAVRAPRL
jgi:N-acyl-D-aspartate/D-glutamate deacylase